MTERLRELPGDLGERVASALRERDRGLTEDLAALLAQEPGLGAAGWRECGRVLLSLLARALEEGELDGRQGPIQALSRFSPPLTVRQIVHAARSAERLALDELALHARLGATTEPWPAVAQAVRSAMLEIVVAFSDRDGGPAGLHDDLTTLLTRHVFDLALGQEILRARRHKHGIALILFDIDDLSGLNATHGHGAGDRLLERLGILASRFFRTHDWASRHGGDSIAVLLPETTLDQAAQLANRFRQTVEQRLVLIDHKTEAVTSVTMSAAAVGTDLVQVEVDAAYVMAEAEAALLRARMNGGNRVERVALLPTSVTIVGAATLLGRTPREIVRWLRDGTLTATRRGRHFHVDRTQIDRLRRRLAADGP
jgi:diguanylate cyclase (GGDEF)-like protein/excisionase family DNA binding protein